MGIPGGMRQHQSITVTPVRSLCVSAAGMSGELRRSPRLSGVAAYGGAPIDRIIALGLGILRIEVLRLGGRQADKHRSDGDCRQKRPPHGAAARCFVISVHGLTSFCLIKLRIERRSWPVIWRRPPPQACLGLLQLAGLAAFAAKAGVAGVFRFRRTCTSVL